MDRSLWLLYRLRFRALMRRWGKTIRTPKGIVLVLLSLGVMGLGLATTLLTPKEASPWTVDTIRRFGGLILLLYGLLPLCFSMGENSLIFAPAEIDFLFAGPYSRRQLLGFKMVGMVWGLALSGLFMAVGFVRGGGSFLSVYLASALALGFFQLFGISLALGSDTIGLLAIGPRRKLALVGFLVLIAAVVASVGRDLLGHPILETLHRIETSPVLRVATLPFRPFVLAFTATRLWPDLIGWVAVCVAMDLALVAVVFATDAQYLEASANASAAIYAKVETMRRGGVMAALRGKPKGGKSRVPALPWLGGAGPIFWRQLATLARERSRPILLTLVLAVPSFFMLYQALSEDAPDRIWIAFGPAGLALYLSFVFGPLVAYDFRADVDRMGELKALPISGAAVCLGQVATPVSLFVLPLWAAFVAAAIYQGRATVEYAAIAAMALPTVFLVFAVDNLLFLIFPVRLKGASPGDLTAVGRQVLLLLFKFVAILVVGGLSAGVGVAAHLVAGASRPWSLLASLATATGLASLMVPALAVGFDRLDVSRDTPG